MTFQELMHLSNTHKQKVLYFLLCAFFMFLLGSCCADHSVKEVWQGGQDLENGLRNAGEEQYLIFAYIEYNRVLKENIMYLGGHYWDKPLTLISFATLIGVLLLMWLIVKRVKIIYYFLDGQPDVLLNTICGIALSLNIGSWFGYNPLDIWYIPTAILVVGIALAVCLSTFPRSLEWLNKPWQKYIRRSYIAAYTVFAFLCLIDKPAWEIPIF